jgi:ferric-dicitrate binding protein FerR (iron transport regulator)
VTLEEGSVRINSSDGEMNMKPGMQALIFDGKITSRMVDTELYTSWHRGHIVFKNERLETITKQLEKMYDVNFHYKVDTLRSFRYRGTIRLDNSILKALDMLQISTGIKYEVDGNRVVLSDME